MRHYDTFVAVDTATDQDLGYVCIARESEGSKRFSYYFRNPKGEYTRIFDLGSMTVREAREFEHTQLRALVQEKIGLVDPERWKFYLAQESIWNRSCRIEPEISNENWIESFKHLAVD